MKWIALAPMIAFLTACGCCRDVVEYRQVTVAPVIAAPVYYNPPVTIIDEDPIDVTTTTIEYY